MDVRTDPQNTSIVGRDSGGGWWVFPLALLLVTLVLIVAAAVIQGPGQDSGSAGVGQTVSSPAASPAPQD